MSARLSKIGPWVSVVCAIHCMISPIVLGLIPMIHSKSEMLEDVLIAVSIIIGILSIAGGYREHRRVIVVAMLIVSVALLAGSQFSERFEESGVIGGALVMAGAQFLNLRYQKRCCAHEHELAVR